jgi:hypothetical protein
MRDPAPRALVVRTTEPPPPLEPAPPIALRLVIIPPARKPRWIDSVAAGLLICGAMLVGVVLVALAMGWVRP